MKYVTYLTTSLLGSPLVCNGLLSKTGLVTFIKAKFTTKFCTRNAPQETKFKRVYSTVESASTTSSVCLENATLRLKSAKAENMEILARHMKSATMAWHADPLLFGLSIHSA